jgi:hypothetical protein
MTWRAALLFLGGCSFSVPSGGVQPDDASGDAPIADATVDPDAAIDAMGDAMSDAMSDGPVVSPLVEAAAIRTYLLAQNPVYKTFGVGAVQNPNATTVGAGWVDFRDQTLDPALWGTYTAVQQPDDGAVSGQASFEDHQQNLAFFDLESTGTHPYLRDGNGTGSNYVFLCECDGFTVGTTARGYVDNDINNPN